MGPVSVAAAQQDERVGDFRTEFLSGDGTAGSPRRGRGRLHVGSGRRGRPRAATLGVPVTQPGEQPSWTLTRGRFQDPSASDSPNFGTHFDRLAQRPSIWRVFDSQQTAATDPNEHIPTTGAGARCDGPAHWRGGVDLLDPRGSLPSPWWSSASGLDVCVTADPRSSPKNPAKQAVQRISTMVIHALRSISFTLSSALLIV
jgi:hypothetical protein